eukprot:snap_masked-scaffold_22-processed-gene-2.18-mRNA-1 protein AED:1.00 eAED:1.00 QI:0/-1/0/0/-1/1/1/0/93
METKVLSKETISLDKAKEKLGLFLNKRENKGIEPYPHLQNLLNGLNNQPSLTPFTLQDTKVKEESNEEKLKYEQDTEESQPEDNFDSTDSDSD